MTFTCYYFNFKETEKMRMREGHNTEMETTTPKDIGIEYKLSVVTIDW